VIVFARPGIGDADYVLEVFCVGDEGHGYEPHEEVVLTHIGHWPDPASGRPIGFLNWLAAEGSIQTPFSEKLEAELRSGEPVDLGGWSGTPRGMDYATRWRFHCPRCPRTVPGHGRKMDEILDKLRSVGVPRLSLPALASRLTS
jgi:hypothetical protein